MFLEDYELSIVIPCYNEQENLPFLFARLQELLDQFPATNIILVNNGSTDGSSQRFAKFISSNVAKNISLVDIPLNKGYGYGIMQGVLAAKTEVVAWCHADLQTDPMDVVEAYQLYRSLPEGLKIIKGERKRRNFLDAFFTAGMSVFASLSLGCKLSDINAQPKLFDRSFLNLIKDNYPYDFSLDLYVLLQAHKHNYSIFTYPVFFNARLHGEAKGGGSMKGKIKLIKRTVSYILDTRKKNRP